CALAHRERLLRLGDRPAVLGALRGASARRLSRGHARRWPWWPRASVGPLHVAPHQRHALRDRGGSDSRVDAGRRSKAPPAREEARGSQANGAAFSGWRCPPPIRGETPVTTQYKVDEETAEGEFLRMCAGRRIDTNIDDMSP